MTRNLTILFLLCVTIGLSGCGVEGIHSANPRTTIGFNRWSGDFEIYNNKDVDVTAKGIEVDVPNKVAKADEIVISDNASKVREVNPLQIDAVSRQTEMIYNAWGQMFTSLMNALTSLTLKIGGETGWNSAPANTAQLNQLAIQVAELQQAVLDLKTHLAASQPAQ